MKKVSGIKLFNMRYTWYNNGHRNMKIYKNDTPPEGYTKGYKLRKSLFKRNERIKTKYIKNMENFSEKVRKYIKKGLLKVQKEYLEDQEKLFPETIHSISKDFIPPEQIEIIKDMIFDPLKEEYLKKQSEILK